MKKLLLIILLIFGMALSFAAIVLVMLFATGVVKNMDEARALITGVPPGVDSTYTKPGPVVQVQDALQLLQQQKQELQQDLTQLKEDRNTLEQQKDTLSAAVSNLSQQTQKADSTEAKLQATRLEQTVALYNAMRATDAASIMDQMSDDMILQILPRLQQRQAASILNALSDDAKKARISAMLLEGKKAAAKAGGP